MSEDRVDERIREELDLPQSVVEAMRETDEGIAHGGTFVLLSQVREAIGNERGRWVIAYKLKEKEIEECRLLIKKLRALLK